MPFKGLGIFVNPPEHNGMWSIREAIGDVFKFSNIIILSIRSIL